MLKGGEWFGNVPAGSTRSVGRWDGASLSCTHHMPKLILQHAGRRRPECALFFLDETNDGD